MQQPVVIVGAGPVGCATALHLARRGVASVVLDRAREPSEKVCGEGLMPHGVRELRGLGLGGHMACYGTLDPTPITLPPRLLMMPVARVSGFFLPNWLAQQHPLRLLWIITRLRGLLAAGHFATPVGPTYPLEQVHQALQAATTPGREGKVLIDTRPGT